jgi:hypothetical protein
LKRAFSIKAQWTFFLRFDREVNYLLDLCDKSGLGSDALVRRPRIYVYSTPALNRGRKTPEKMRETWPAVAGPALAGVGRAGPAMQIAGRLDRMSGPAAHHVRCISAAREEGPPSYKGDPWFRAVKVGCGNLFQANLLIPRLISDVIPSHFAAIFKRLAILCRQVLKRDLVVIKRHLFRWPIVGVTAR